MLCGPAWLSHHCLLSAAPSLSPVRLWTAPFFVKTPAVKGTEKAFRTHPKLQPPDIQCQQSPSHSGRITTKPLGLTIENQSQGEHHCQTTEDGARASPCKRANCLLGGRLARKLSEVGLGSVSFEDLCVARISHQPSWTSRDSHPSCVASAHVASHQAALPLHNHIQAEEPTEPCSLG